MTNIDPEGLVSTFLHNVIQIKGFVAGEARRGRRLCHLENVNCTVRNRVILTVRKEGKRGKGKSEVDRISEKRRPLIDSRWK